MIAQRLQSPGDAVAMPPPPAAPESAKESPPDAAGPLRSQLARDPAIEELLSDYVRGLGDKVAAMEQSLQENDLATLTALAHRLKGSAGTYGFDPVSRAAAHLEQAAKASADLATLDTLVREIASLCSRCTA
jgi:HPt (histidine-containing phosphotransfer) domain-containing protein